MITSGTAKDSKDSDTETLKPGQSTTRPDFKGEVTVTNLDTQSTALVSMSNPPANEVYEKRRAVNPTQIFPRTIEPAAKQLKVDNDSQVATIKVDFNPL